MMLNINGSIISKSESQLSHSNRGFKYGDAVFETIKAAEGRFLFMEDHYFRLMASMRIMRMLIPKAFTMDYFKEQLQRTLHANNLQKSVARIRMTVFREEGGFYTPSSKDISFVIECDILATSKGPYYEFLNRDYTIDIFRDFAIAPHFVSTIKTNNRALNVIAGIYAKENDFDDVFLINTNKNIVETLAHNVFVQYGSVIKTPPISDGCVNGIFRKQLLRCLDKQIKYTLKEASILPFELQTADSILLTNVISGITPVTRFRKKTYDTQISQELTTLVNQHISKDLDYRNN